MWIVVQIGFKFEAHLGEAFPVSVLPEVTGLISEEKEKEEFNLIVFLPLIH